MASKAELALILSLVDEVSDVAKSVKGDLLDVGKAGQGVQGIMGSTAKGLMSLGSTAVLGAIGLVTAAVVAIGGAAFASAMKLDEAFDTIQIGTGATGSAKGSKRTSAACLRRSRRTRARRRTCSRR